MLHRIFATSASWAGCTANRKSGMKNPAKPFFRALSIAIDVLLLVSCAQPTPLPTATSLPTHTAAATSTPAPLPTSTPTITPTPVGGGTGKLIFEYVKAGYEKDFPELGGESQIFMANVDGTELIPVTKGLMTHNTLADVSPDGSKLLVITWPDLYTAAESTSAVYVVDLDHLEHAPVKLASGIMYTPNKTAVWLDNSRVVLVDKEEGSWGVYLMNSDGTGRKKLSKYVAGVRHYNLRVSADARWVFWNGFGFEGGQYSDGGIWRASVDGSELSHLDGDKNITINGISPDGSQVVWKVTERGYHFENINIASVSDLYHPTVWDMDGAVFRLDTEILWSPSGKEVLLNRGTFITYTGRVWTSVTKILSLEDMELREIKLPLEYQDFFVTFPEWSPDGRCLLLRVFPTSLVTEQVPSKIQILDLETMTFSEVLTKGVSHDAIGGISWIP